MRSILGISLAVVLAATPPFASDRDIVRTVATEWQAWNDSINRARPTWSTWGVEAAEAREARWTRYRQWISTLNAVRAESLDATDDRLTYLGLSEGLSRQLANAACRDELWNVNPLGGPHLSLAATLDAVARDSGAAQRQSARLGAFPQALAVLRSDLERGVTAGYSASRDNVDRVVGQVDVILRQLGEGSNGPGMAELVRLGVADSLAASLRLYRDYLATTYRTAARAEGSLREQPDGAACYRARVKLIAGVDLEPESLLTIAARGREAIDAELAPILARLVGPRPLAEAKRALRTEARFLFTSREEMISEAQALEARLTPASAKLFRNPPSVPLRIVQTPAFREQSDPPARYGAPSGPNGTGTFFLNTWRPDSQPRWNLPVAVSHEGAPGHHFERTYVRNIQVPPAARLYGTGSYLEGWGMYAEEIAARETGVLEDDLSRAGFLMHFLDAWNGLELDIRMHLQGWTREQVIARTIEVTGKSRTIAAVYADRHASTPGQIASYMAGYHAIRSMRDEAAVALGSRFDVRDFHERYLETGALPLTTVRDRVRRWVAESR